MKIIDANNQKKWDEFVSSHEDANFLQSWAWGDFHEARRKKVVRRVAVDDENNILAAYVGQVETAKRGTYMAIAGGPIMDWSNKKLREAVFADIKEQGVANKCVFVRVRPQIIESDKNRKLFKDLGLTPAPIYLSVEYAGILDISKSEEEILAGASQGLRRKIRKAQKNDITVSTSTDPKDIKKFYEIELQTAARHNFVEFSEDFLRKQFEAFAKYGEVKLYTAKLGDEILAQNFMIFYGNEASYHYGVSTELGTKYSGAPLLHMQAMRDARERGIRRYNFWGITALDDAKHRFYGVSQFKRSFGVEELIYLHAHDLVIKPAQYKLAYLLEKTRAKIRHV
ncbi:MAG: peptidoglycan bridge formation glycyltransferase FemA/FemB family protein [Candidatus Saccharibacteria bacterium]|nr:peptidoglycan bridge formation glycyltransferase FemA/FemB family protein [Candidatus Saccharibacteria bacterium]